MRNILARLICLAAILWAWHAGAHDAPSGWGYPYECCSNQDCAPYPARLVRLTDHGYQLANGNVVPFRERRVSGDGQYHLCQTRTGKLICFFAPPEGF